VRVLRGISTEIFFKLCWRAPRTVMLLIAIKTGTLGRAKPHSQAELLGKRTVRSAREYAQLYSVSYGPRMAQVKFRRGTVRF
jgi:hypothetical protein